MIHVCPVTLQAYLPSYIHTVFIHTTAVWVSVCLSFCWLTLVLFSISLSLSRFSLPSLSLFVSLTILTTNRYISTYIWHDPWWCQSQANQLTEQLFLLVFSGVTILLSLTVFSQVVAESMPATSDAVPLLGNQDRSKQVLPYQADFHIKIELNNVAMDVHVFLIDVLHTIHPTIQPTKPSTVTIATTEFFCVLLVLTLPAHAYTTTYVSCYFYYSSSLPPHSQSMSARYHICWMYSSLYVDTRH